MNSDKTVHHVQKSAKQTSLQRKLSEIYPGTWISGRGLKDIIIFKKDLNAFASKKELVFINFADYNFISKAKTDRMMYYPVCLPEGNETDHETGGIRESGFAAF